MKLQEMVERLSAAIGAPVTVEDTTGDLLAYSAHPYTVDSARLETILGKRVSSETLKVLKKKGIYEMIEASPTPVRIDPVPEARLAARVAFAIRDSGETVGYVWVVPEGPLDPEKELLLVRKSRDLALCITREKASDETLKQQRAELIADLVCGRLPGRESWARRAQGLGWTLAPPFQVLVIEVEGDFMSCREGVRGADHRISREAVVEGRKPWDSTGRVPNSAGRKAKSPETVDTVARQVLSSLGIAPVMSFHDESLVLILTGSARDLRSRSIVDSASPGTAAAAVAESIAGSLETCAGITSYVGVGRQYDEIRQIKKSYCEACEALEMGKRIGGKERVFDYHHLGLYSLVGCLVTCEKACDFGRREVSSLVDYDERHGTELSRTLEVFLDCRSKRKEASKRLGIHQNTFDYRMRRIAEIGRIDLWNTELLMAIYIWIKSLKYAGNDPFSCASALQIQPGRLSGGR